MSLLTAPPPVTLGVENDSPVLAAGTLISRGPAGAREVVVVHRPRGDWGLPKGKVTHGEQLQAAAVRETREETGFTVRLGQRLGRTAYGKDGWPKEVMYFSATARSGAFVPSREVDDLRWLPIPEAAALVTRADDIRVLREFEMRPTTTSTLILLRHGTVAGGPDDHERLRPLDEAGAAQARAVGAMLSAYGPIVLHSADSVRCRQTVEPYARSAGLTILGDKRLRGRHFDPDHALFLAEQAVDDGRPTVICAHKPALRSVLAALSRRHGLPPYDQVTVPKSGMVVLHTSPGHVDIVERHLPR